MRWLWTLALVAGACTLPGPTEEGGLPGEGAALLPREAGAFPSEDAAIAAYRRVSERVTPIAERICREENPNQPALYCDFRVVALRDRRLPPGALQTIDRRGQPVIAFSLSLLQDARNEDEIAFILGHEAGHQIANHILRSTAQRRLGASLLAGVAAGERGTSIGDLRRAGRFGAFLGGRAYSKSFEVEADVIGAYLAEFAGYDPLLGAQSFARFRGGSNAELSTHPPSEERLATVARVAVEIQRVRARGGTPRLPGR